MCASLTPLQKLVGWYTRQNPVELWLDLLRNAEAFEDWEEAALHLDSILGLDLWYFGNPRRPPEPSRTGLCTDSRGAGETTRRPSTTTGGSSRTGSTRWL